VFGGQRRTSSIHDNPESSTLSIADDQNQPIVELLSEFGSGPNASSARPTPEPVTVAAPADRSPASVEDQPHIFVQIDAQDSAASGTKVIQSLRTEWPAAKVEPRPERIPTQKMPDGAQVRYFNESDLARATRCASILKPTYPNVRLVRIGLLSPKGQLEVWLPKVTPAGAVSPAAPK
jgi:hypothetical protein